MDVLWDVRCNSENLILCSGHQMTVAVALGYPPVEQFEQRVVGLCAERFELWTNCWHRTINTCHGYKTNGLFDWNQFHVNKSKHIPFCYRHRDSRCQGGRERNWGEVTFCDSIGQIALTLDWPNSWKHICYIWNIWNMIYMLYVLYMIYDIYAIYDIYEIWYISIRAPSKQGMYWEIHSRRLTDLIPET